jgi:hypothetical protein
MGRYAGTRLSAALAAATLALSGLGAAPALAQGTGGSSSPPPDSGATGGSGAGVGAGVGGDPGPPPSPAPPPSGGNPSPPLPPKPSSDPLLAAVDTAQIAGAIDATRAAGYRSIYNSALSTVATLSGRRRAELAAVIRIARSIAVRRLLTPTRLALIYLTLARNVQWWSRRGPPAPGSDTTVIARGSAATRSAAASSPAVGSAAASSAAVGSAAAIGAPVPASAAANCGVSARISRVVFRGSGVVFEYYPGMGLQLQVNGTFGAANALLRQGTATSLDSARRLLDEMGPLISSRDGLPTWEYAFPFEAGRPPWTSALSQGTAIEAYTTAAAKLHRPDYLVLARELSGILGRRAPSGVELVLPARDGDWFLLYSFARGELVLNAHLDAVVALTDLAAATHDPQVATLAARGLRATRRRIHLFDTGRWSRYQQGGPPADLNYHVLNRDLAGALCQRTRDNVVCGAWRRFTRELEARCPRTSPSGTTTRGALPGAAPRSMPRRLA